MDTQPAGASVSSFQPRGVTVCCAAPAPQDPGRSRLAGGDSLDVFHLILREASGRFAKLAGE